MEITKLVWKFEHLEAPTTKWELKVTKYMFRVPLKWNYVLAGSQHFSAEYSSVLYGDYKNVFKI